MLILAVFFTMANKDIDSKFLFLSFYFENLEPIKGLQKNLAKAFDYFQSASREGTRNSNIDYNVGIMKLKGEGVEVFHR